MYETEQPILDPKSIRIAFNKAATTYNQVAILQNEIAQRLLERLTYMRLQPLVILDCGARTTFLTKQLNQCYPNSQVVAVEIAEKMLDQGQADWRSPNAICSNLQSLPIASKSVDLVISNLALHWVSDIRTCLQEWQRVLRPGGLLLFSTLGPDTLIELRESFAQIDQFEHVHHFIDMHHIGDALLGAHWIDPVMDMEYLNMEYTSLMDLMHDLKSAGLTNQDRDRMRGLMGKNRWQKMLSSYPVQQNQEYPYTATFEIIYGHAWCGVGGFNQDNEIAIPIESIIRRK